MFAFMNKFRSYCGTNFVMTYIYIAYIVISLEDKQPILTQHRPIQPKMAAKIQNLPQNFIKLVDLKKIVIQ